MLANRLISRTIFKFPIKNVHNSLISIRHQLFASRCHFHTGIDNSSVILEKSMLLKHPKSTTIPPKKEETKIEKNEKPSDLIQTLSEQLIADTNLNTHKPTMAENEIDTMSITSQLVENGFSDMQSQSIVKVIMSILNDEFYSSYNDKYLRDFEIDKQLHLFNSLTSEIHFIIANSRDTQFNLHHLQITRLKRDLNLDLDNLNEDVIEILEKDRKLDFNNQKVDNTLLYRRINMSLRDCSNKISINILAGIKLDIENLRWHTTRSGLVAIVILVFFILTCVNVSNKKSNAEPEVKEVTLKIVDPEEINNDDDDNREYPPL